jgi:hypothetical protein
MARRQKKTERHVQIFMLLLGLVGGIIGVSLAHGMTGMVGAATANVNPLVEPYLETYDAKIGDGMPDLVFLPLGDNVVSVRISDKDRSFYGLIEKGELAHFDEGLVERPTISVALDYDTLVALQYGDVTFDDVIGAGEVSLFGIGYIDLTFVEVVLGTVDVYALQ